MTARYTLTRIKAREILTAGKVSGPPVPVEQLAEQVAHAQIRREPFEGKLSGMVHRRRDGRVIIGVNSEHSDFRQRFTIAHELGHLLLHSDQHLHIDEAFPIGLRDEISSLAIDVREIEANQFAAELLMPFDMLKSYVADMEIDIADDDKNIARLADIFQVSRQAMTIRLTRLNVWR